MEALVVQLEYEIENYVKKYNKSIDTIFIGGGTPSAISFTEYEKVFKIIHPYINSCTEITTEANPNSATIDWLKGMHDLGVNRVSFGVQSFNDEKLKLLGRSHSSNRAIKAIQDAKCIGFNSINCDIIYGVEGDSIDSLKKDFDIISTLPIDHISAYSLTIEEGTKFFYNTSVKIDDEELSVEIFEDIASRGFVQYEISNFSKSINYESKHNKGYWEHKEYLGVGAGAVGYKNKIRYYPHKEIEKYIETPLFSDKEELSEMDIKTEKILLGFRCSLGVEYSILNENEMKKVDILIENKKITIKNDRIFNDNFLLADELALYILE